MNPDEFEEMQEALHCLGLAKNYLPDMFFLQDNAAMMHLYWKAMEEIDLALTHLSLFLRKIQS